MVHSRMGAVAHLASAMCLALVLATASVFGGQPVFVKIAVAAAPAGLHVAGTRLVDAHGKPVQLRGVDISGTEFACAQGGKIGNRGWSIYGGQPEDSAGTINAMQRWHINAVRVPLNEDCWLGLNGINPEFGGAGYRAAIGKFVADLSNAGMYVVVDLHWSAPGAAVALSQQPMADSDHAPAFWTSVANVFAKDLNVLFDLYNEPFLYGSYFKDPKQDPWSCWLNGCELNQYLTGGQPYTEKYSWQTAGMQQLMDVVRATGASNIVIVNGVDWANDNSGWLAHRPHDPTGNLAAGWHEYGGEQCAAIDCWSRTIAPIARVVPVVVGETGDHTGKGCTLTNLPTFLPWADSHGLSYLAWTFNPWGYNHDVLITDWQGTPSACEGQYYAAHLASASTSTPSPPESPAPSTGPPPSTPPLSSGHINQGGPRVLYFTIVLIGLLTLALALVVATNVGAIATHARLRRSIQQHRSAVSIGLATCGFMFCLSAFVLLNRWP